MTSQVDIKLTINKEVKMWGGRGEMSRVEGELESDEVQQETL